MLGQALATAGYPVLIIDNDSQGSISLESLQQKRSQPGIDKVYSGELTLRDCLAPTHIENLYVVPCGKNLRENATVLETQGALRKRVVAMFTELRNELVENFDYVIFDNPPNDFGHPRYCSEMADKIVIPVVPDETCYSALVRTYSKMELTYPNWKNQKVYIVTTLLKVTRRLHLKYMAAIQKFVDAICQSQVEMRGSEALFNTTFASTTIADVVDVPEIIAGHQNLFQGPRATSAIATNMRSLVLEIFDDIPKEEFEGILKKFALDAKNHRFETLRQMAKAKKSVATPDGESRGGLDEKDIERMASEVTGG